MDSRGEKRKIGVLSAALFKTTDRMVKKPVTAKWLKVKSGETCITAGQ